MCARDLFRQKSKRLNLKRFYWHPPSFSLFSLPPYTTTMNEMMLTTHNIYCDRYKTSRRDSHNRSINTIFAHFFSIIIVNIIVRHYHHSVFISKFLFLLSKAGTTVSIPVCIHTSAVSPSSIHNNVFIFLSSNMVRLINVENNHLKEWRSWTLRNRYGKATEREREYTAKETNTKQKWNKCLFNLASKSWFLNFCRCLSFLFVLAFFARSLGDSGSPFFSLLFFYSHWMAYRQWWRLALLMTMHVSDG